MSESVSDAEAHRLEEQRAAAENQRLREEWARVRLEWMRLREENWELGNMIGTTRFGELEAHAGVSLRPDPAKVDIPGLAAAAPAYGTADAAAAAPIPMSPEGPAAVGSRPEEEPEVMGEPGGDSVDDEKDQPDDDDES